MSRKIPLGIAIAAAFIAAAISVAVTVTVYSDSYNRLIRDLPQRSSQYAVLSEIDEIIREHYYGDVELDKVLSNMAAGYIQGLNDEQCFYIPEENLDAYESTVAGNIPGTGVTAVYDAASHCLVIRDVAQGSPAAEAGLSAGNRISAVDQTAVTQTNSSQLINLLFAADKKNTTLELLETGADGKEARRLVTVRNGYTAQSCLTNTVGGVGYVVFTDFYPDTAARFDEALTAFTDKGVKSLVIDVRNCQSVNYEQAAQVIDRIVPMAGEGIGAIAAAVDKNGNTVRLFSSGSDQVNMTIAVLINDRTAGAAELLACDLRDFGKAKLFGEKTAGEGSYPELFSLEDGGAVLLAVAKIRPYLSEPFDEIGVSPDTEVPLTDAEKNALPPAQPENDPQFAAAYAFLTGNPG